MGLFVADADYNRVRINDMPKWLLRCWKCGLERVYGGDKVIGADSDCPNCSIPMMIRGHKSESETKDE